MKKITHSILRGVVKIVKFIIHCHCWSNIIKCHVVVAISELLTFFYRIFLFLIHANEKNIVKIVEEGPKFIKSVEVFYKEGLAGLGHIAGYIRINFNNDKLIVVSQNKKYLKFRVSRLEDFFKKKHYKRDEHCTIIIKDNTRSFRIILNPIKQYGMKYIAISNIIKETILPIELQASCVNDDYHHCRKFHVIDKITHHDKNDVKGSVKSLKSFMHQYADYFAHKNVSWYTKKNSNKYQIMVASDIVGSTSLWCRSAREMSLAITKHDYTALYLIEKYNGRAGRNEGDSFFVFFEDIIKATRFAINFNKEIRKIKILDGNLAIKIAIHAGVVKMSASPSLDACGKHVNKIEEMLSNTPSNKISISKKLTNKYASSDLFCVH